MIRTTSSASPEHRGLAEVRIVAQAVEEAEEAIEPLPENAPNCAGAFVERHEVGDALLAIVQAIAEGEIAGLVVDLPDHSASGRWRESCRHTASCARTLPQPCGQFIVLFARVSPNRLMKRNRLRRHRGTRAECGRGCPRATAMPQDRAAQHRRQREILPRVVEQIEQREHVADFHRIEVSGAAVAMGADFMPPQDAGELFGLELRPNEAG